MSNGLHPRTLASSRFVAPVMIPIYISEQTQHRGKKKKKKPNNNKKQKQHSYLLGDGGGSGRVVPSHHDNFNLRLLDMR
jgi:hypothetical protein